ncbi:MAG: lysylphosphatidylglycerol synthase transmembrane domain-containing protein [Ardenticatenaceae bacterium]|nr:lysylphosphatidylglycerol synthase transmembrane domain-containing protein [Ardenticatenaceae bacterium]
MKPLKKYGGAFLRVAITVIGLGFAAQQINFNQMVDLLSQANWIWVFAGFMLVNLSMVVRAYRWQRLLVGAGARQIRFIRLIELYFVGNFFNAFLPSGFGGDVVRAVEVTREIPADVATGTVFLDRLSGLIVLFVMGLIALPFRPAGFPEFLTLSITVVSVGGLVASFLLLDGRLVSWFSRLPLSQKLPALISPAGDGPLAKFLAAVSSCGWPAIWQAIGVSAIFSLLLVGWWVMATYALNTPISLAYGLLVVPIFAVALLVPTFGGLGVREVIAPILFAGAGLSDSAAVSTSLIVFLMLRLSGLIGAPIYLISIWRNQKNT